MVLALGPGMFCFSEYAAAQLEKTISTTSDSSNHSSLNSSGRIAKLGSPELTPQNDAVSLLGAKEHPWGRFPVSSWNRVQTITQITRNGKTSQSIKETKTTLKSVDKDGITLEESSIVGFGGRQIETAPTRKRFDFFQQPIAEGVLVADVQPEKLVVDHLIVPCEKRVYRYSVPSGNIKTTVWYSTQIYPYIFRVEQIHRSHPTNRQEQPQVLNQSTTEVLESTAFDLRKRHLGTYRIQTIRKSGDITTVSEMSCDRNVPGGMLKETVREFDANGQPIRVIETRLLNSFDAEHTSMPESKLSSLLKDRSTLRFENSRLRVLQDDTAPTAESVIQESTGSP